MYVYLGLVQTHLHLRTDSSTTAEASKYGSTSARCCNYSFKVLLMRGEVITRNM